MRILESDRLLLRRPERRDIPAIVPLANDYDVAKNLSTMPHPYTAQDGEAYLARLEEKRDGADFVFAITRKTDSVYMGGIGLHRKDDGNEFGYWLGKPFWRQGYATEAARLLIGFAFDELGVDDVLAKLGCEPKGFEKRSCLARGMEIGCNLVTLSRETYLLRRAA